MNAPLPPNPDPPVLRQALWRTGLRLAVLVGLALILNAGVGWLLTQINTLNSIAGAPGMVTLLIVALVCYALLIAIPFMPGIEVGIALLLLQGAAIAPFVYLATVCGLFVAFLVGRGVPLGTLHTIFRDLRMMRACAYIRSIEDTPKDARLARLNERLPKPLAKLVVNYRYVMLGVLINIPGTFAIGGGGGILMLAGILRLFHWTGILLMLLLATLPVPFAVWYWGAEAVLP